VGSGAHSDVSLLRRARREPEAFGVFYDRHAPALLRWALARVCDRQVALDLVAESFAEALVALPKFRGERPGSAAAWLYGIARNLLLRYLEQQAVDARARQRLKLEPIAIASDAEAVGERLELAGRGEDARVALDRLPTLQRRAIELRVVRERPYTEVAAELGCTQVAARLRVSRGLRMLHQLLGEA
jgi:RNA polymerase sigma factor (sigma-70 family)